MMKVNPNLSCILDLDLLTPVFFVLPMEETHQYMKSAFYGMYQFIYQEGVVIAPMIPGQDPSFFSSDSHAAPEEFYNFIVQRSGSICHSPPNFSSFSMNFLLPRSSTYIYTKK